MWTRWTSHLGELGSLTLNLALGALKAGFSPVWGQAQGSGAYLIQASSERTDSTWPQVQSESPSEYICVQAALCFLLLFGLGSPLVFRSLSRVACLALIC